MPDRDTTGEHEPEVGGERAERPGSRIRRLGRRILREVDPERPPEPREPKEPRSILGDAKEVFGAVLEGSDKAKTEVVRAVAREVRHYLEELGLKDDVKNLLTNYSFEIHASVNLRRLADAEKAPRETRPARAKREEPEDEGEM